MTSYAIYLGPEVQKDTLGLDQICTRALAAWERIRVSCAQKSNRYLVGEVWNDVLRLRVATDYSLIVSTQRGSGFLGNIMHIYMVPGCTRYSQASQGF